MTIVHQEFDVVIRQAGVVVQRLAPAGFRRLRKPLMSNYKGFAESQANSILTHACTHGSISKLLAAEGRKEEPIGSVIAGEAILWVLLSALLH